MSTAYTLEKHYISALHEIISKAMIKLIHQDNSTNNWYLKGNFLYKIKIKEHILCIAIKNLK